MANRQFWIDILDSEPDQKSRWYAYGYLAAIDDKDRINPLDGLSPLYLREMWYTGNKDGKGDLYGEDGSG